MHEQTRAAYVGRLRRGEEQAGGGDIGGGCHPLQRNSLCHRRGGCLVAVVTRRGIGRDETWDHAVETYPRRPLDREARHQVLEASLCGTVGGSARRWAAATDAADHDDRAALILA